MAKRTNTAVWEAKHNRWKINVQKDGTRRSFYSGTPGRAGQREANTKADAWLDDGITGGQRVDSVMSGYIADLKLTTSKSNWIKVESIHKNWISPFIGQVKMENLTEQHLQTAINRAAAKGLARKSLHNIMSVLTAMTKYARRCKATTLNPEGLSVPKSARAETKRILQPESLQILMTSDQTQRYGKVVADPLIHAYRFQVLTGLRPGELMGLMRGDIVGNAVHIQRSINAYGEITRGKNDNAVRKVELSTHARTELAAQLEQCDELYLFGTTSLSSYANRWRAYCEANAIPYVSLYELRHTFVSIAKALPEGQLKAVVGHSRNMDTWGIYGHSVDGEGEATARQLDQIFGGILDAKKE